MRSVVGTAMNGYEAAMTPSECRGSLTARYGLEGPPDRDPRCTQR